MGAQRGARCPLRVAHHRVSGEVLVVSGAGSCDGALRRLKCSGSLITRQDEPEAPSEHEPLAQPRATETRDKATTVPLPPHRKECEWASVGPMLQSDSTETEREREREKASPHKKDLQRKPQVQGSHLQTRSLYGFQMVKMAAMPSVRATTRPPLIRLEV